MSEPFAPAYTKSLSFLPNTMLQVAWDSTSMGELKSCPRKYFYTIVMGYTPRQTNIHLTFGLIYHAALERYDHAKAQGLGHVEGQLMAVRYVLQETWNRDLGRPWESGDAYKNRMTLLRSVVWYLEQFEEDPLTTVILANGKPAVELSFRVETGHMRPDGQPYIYAGHLDRLALLNKDPWIIDRKTTKSTLGPYFFDSFTPQAQFSGYVFGGQISLSTSISGLIVDAAQIAVGFSAFQRSPVARSKGQIDEWHEDLGQWFTNAEQYARQARWPMNEASCGNYGGCPFREVCSKSPGSRELWLDRTFARRVWDPLVARGDV